MVNVPWCHECNEPDCGLPKIKCPNSKSFIKVESFSGGVWKTIPVDQQPEIFLSRWQLFIVDDTDCHFMGTESGQGRVSSKILEFDKVKMRGRTRSGRVYQLEGAPGTSMDALYVFGAWLGINGLKRNQAKMIDIENIK